MQRWVKLDYDYDSKSHTRMWKLASESTINVEVVDKDFLTSLQVAQVLEK